MIISVLWLENQKDENDFDYTLLNFKSDKVYVMGGFECTSLILKDCPAIVTLDEVIEDYPIVLMMPETSRNFTPTESLQNFTHPTNAIYVFGPNNQILSNDHIGSKTISSVVSIPSDTLNEEMFNYTAYAITMWDRKYG